jgi:hypothetical protein
MQSLQNSEYGICQQKIFSVSEIAFSTFHMNDIHAGISFKGSLINQYAYIDDEE